MLLSVVLMYAKASNIIHLGISIKDVVYIGDDVNDMPCIDCINKAGGLTACPRNTIKMICEQVTYVCLVDGGVGAVREVIDYVRDN